MTGPARSVTVSVGATLGNLGLGQSGYRLGRALQLAGQRVRVICAGSPPGLLAGVRVDTVSLGRLPRAMMYTPLRAWPSLRLAAGNNLFDWRARRLVESCDIFYGYSDQSLWSLRTARRLGALTVLHAANTHIEDMYDELQREARLTGVWQNWISRLMVWKIKREYAAADLIRAESMLVRDSLIRHGVPAEKVLFVPATVDLDRFRPRERPVDGVFRVAFVGAFHLRKGIHYLLRAWDTARLPNSRLILQGGAGSRYMNRLLMPYRARQDVEFRDADPEETYADADVCVVPSVEDGFALVVLEALASGCPVIVSDRVGAKDAVRDGENGFVVPSRDVAALCARLWVLHDRWRNPAVWCELTRAARRSAEAYTFAAEGAALAAGFDRALQEWQR